MKLTILAFMIKVLLPKNNLF